MSYSFKNDEVCEDCGIGPIQRLMVCDDCDNGKNFDKIFKLKVIRAVDK